MKRNMVNSISDKLIGWNGGYNGNGKDSRIMVPRTPPRVGWDVNYANPKAVVIFLTATIILAALLIGITMFIDGIR